MCEVSKEKNDTFITSYQRAHYYKNLQIMNPIQSLEEKSKLRPDLYYYDPIVNEKRSLYKKNFVKKDSSQMLGESYGRLWLTRKHTLKYLFDEYLSKAPKTLNNNDTTTGYHHQDPNESDDTKLIQKFYTKCSPIEINSSFNGKQHHCEFIYPYVSVSNITHEDFSKSQLNGIAKNDIITCYNGLEKNKVPPPPPKDYKINRRVNFKVPFGGESTVYKENFKHPDKMSDFMEDVLVHPNYLESTKNDVPTECKIYSTEPKLLELGNSDHATC